MASKSKIVGFLGGADTALLRRYEAGFTAGAEAGGPSVRVLVRYASRVPDYRGFDDPVLAGRVAQQMLDRGVDVLFAAAGAAQFGAVQAVVEQSAELHRQLWAIGADVDLYTWPEWQRGPDDKQHILTSMIKRFDVVSYEAVRDFAAGTLKSGTRVYDLASNQMALAKSGGYLAPYQPRLDALRRAIIDGHIVVPCVPNGLTGQAAIEAAAGPKCPR
jgi:basic membrane protein A